MLKAAPHGHADEVILEAIDATAIGDMLPARVPLELTFRLTPNASAELRRQLKRAETMLANRRRGRAPRTP